MLRLAVWAAPPESTRVADTSSAVSPTWVAGPSLTISRAGLGLAAPEGKLYAVGGSSVHGVFARTEILDLVAASPTWVASPSLTIERAGLGLAALGNKLYAVGGGYASSEILDLAAASPAWVAGPSLTTARSGFGLAALGNKLYAVGGDNGGWGVGMEILDLAAASPAWVAGPSLTTARNSLGLAALGNKLYAVGGVNGEAFLASTEILDLAAASPAWVAGPSLITARQGPGLAALGGKLYAVGGHGAGRTGSCLTSVEILDLTANSPTWVAGPSLATARQGPGLAALGGKLYAVGGMSDFGNALASTEVLTVYGTCKATVPTQPPTPDPSGSTPLVVYRMQGGTWVANISDADAADLGGLSCFIETFAERWLPKYGAYPMVARYHVAAYAPDARPVGNNSGYKDCTEEPPRSCSEIRGNPYRVGVEATNVTDCSYNGSWYSLPGAGECRVGCTRGGSGDACLGYSCYWQVTSIDKIVAWDCLQSHGCNATLGGCPPTTLESAFEACPNLCTPPVPVEGCGSVASSAISNEIGRYGFDPAQCAVCLQKGAPQYWYSTVGAPTLWDCGVPTSSPIIFEAGGVSNVSDACHCHYADLAPSPSPPCPHGSYGACVIACSELPAPQEPACIAECKRLCPQ